MARRLGGRIARYTRFTESQRPDKEPAEQKFTSWSPNASPPKRRTCMFVTTSLCLGLGPVPEPRHQETNGILAVPQLHGLHEHSNKRENSVRKTNNSSPFPHHQNPSSKGTENVIMKETWQPVVSAGEMAYP